MIDELVKYLPAGPPLFLFQFNAHFIGAVKSHFNAGKKAHQQDSEYEPDYNADLKHWTVKIDKLVRCIRW